MSDTELAWLEQGERVGMVVMLTDRHAIGGMIRYLWWRGVTSSQIAVWILTRRLSLVLEDQWHPAA